MADIFLMSPGYLRHALLRRAIRARGNDYMFSAFTAKYCCSSEDNCLGAQMFNCNRTGFYGTYLFPSLIETPSALTVTYTMSSFSPYNVALFQATFTKN